MRLSLFLALALALPVVAVAQPRFVTTSSDLYSIAKLIGGSEIQLENILPSGQEPHSLPLRPSVIQKIKQAQWLVTIGLDHEPWLPDAISSSGNQRVAPGAPGYVDCSRGVTLVDVPSGGVDRSRGDLHVFGNTHYWLDPENIKLMSVTVTKALSDAVPAKRDEFRNRERAFLKDLAAREAKWRQALAPLSGTKVISYHASFPYLAQFAGFSIEDTVEVKPGIEPTPSHLTQLIDEMKRDHVKIIVMEPWYNRGRAEGVASQAGAKVVVIQAQTPENVNILDNYDGIVKSLVDGIKG